MKRTADAEPRERFSVPARAAAIWAILFGFACLVALAVVVSLGDDDELATVALTLAIFAFGLQIGFFIVQLRVAAAQDRRSADLARETSAVLTKIDERSSATVEVIREQFGFVLQHALGANRDLAALDDQAPDSSGDDEDEERDADSPLTRDDLEAAVARAVRTSLGPDLLARWQEISQPRPQGPTVEERRRRAFEFEREVGRILEAAVSARASQGSVARAANQGREASADFVVQDGDRRGIVDVKFWTNPPLPATLAQRVFDRVARARDAHDAHAAAIVVPGEMPVKRLARLREQAAPIEIVTIEELPSLLARGWPRGDEAAGS